jgi:hypothetical protein
MSCTNSQTYTEIYLFLETRSYYVYVAKAVLKFVILVPQTGAECWVIGLLHHAWLTYIL